MDPVLEQIIADIHPADITKTGLCYQKLSELPIKQDGKLTYLAGRIAGVYQTLQPDVLKKAVIIFAADHAVDGGENKSTKLPIKLVPACCCLIWGWNRIFRSHRACRI